MIRDTIIWTKFEAAAVRIRGRIRSRKLTRPLMVAAVMLIAFELGGIWLEVKGLRREQVKNAAYALHPRALARLRSNSGKESVKYYLRSLESKIGGIDGTVNVDVEEFNAHPIQVEIEDQPVRVEIER